MLEAKGFECASFATYTYTQDTVPEELTYKHFQDYMKRLRKSSRKKIRYFCVGEYGDNTGRPHWHAILLGYRFPEKTTDRFVRNGAILTSHEEWGHGGVTYGQVTEKSIGYCVRYSLKSSQKSHLDRHEVHQSNGFAKEYMIAYGEELARRAPRIVLPSALKYKKRWWPLHKSCMQWMRDAYESRGGEPIRYDLAVDRDARSLSVITGCDMEQLASHVRLRHLRLSGEDVMPSLSDHLQSEAKRARMRSKRSVLL